MGSMKIKSPKGKKRIKAAYNSEINEMREWQENMYNPGHYIGTGRLSYPMKNLARNPKLKLAYLSFTFIPLIIVMFFMKLNWYNILAIVAALAALAFLVWDSKRVLNKVRNRR